MPRAKLIRSTRLAYHVTARSNNREWFYIPPAEAWDIFRDSLRRTAEKYGAEIHTFVLMSNHFHLILSTPGGNLDDVMRYFLSVGTKWIQRSSGRINHVFGARYKSSLLDSPYALAYATKYVLRNPVRAGLCQKVEDYPFSTFNDFGPRLPLVEGFDSYWNFLPRARETRLEWLNCPTPKEQESLVARALRRVRFRFTTMNTLQRDLRGLRANYGVEAPPSAPVPFRPESRLTP